MIKIMIKNNRIKNMKEVLSSEQHEEEPSVEIEEYSNDYRDQVKDLIFDVYENEMGWHTKSGRPDLDKISEIYQKGNGNFWVAVDEGEVVGTIALMDHKDDIATMHRFCVKKEFRGEKRGVSKKLFCNLLNFADVKKFKRILLITSTSAFGAIRFYERSGFKKISLEFLPEDMKKNQMKEDEVLYGLDLPGS